MAATKRRASSSMSPTGVATAAIPLDMGSSKRRRIGLQNAFVSRLLPQLPRHGLRRIAPRQNASSVAQHDQPARILGHPAAIDPLVQAHDYARYQFAIGPQSMLQGRSQGPLRFQLSTGTPKRRPLQPLRVWGAIIPEYRMYTVDYNCHRVRREKYRVRGRSRSHPTGAANYNQLRCRGVAAGSFCRAAASI